jgi:hypothetical protein
MRTPTVIPLSATLNVGQWVRAHVDLEKSVTAPCPRGR